MINLPYQIGLNNMMKYYDALLHDQRDNSAQHSLYFFLFGIMPFTNKEIVRISRELRLISCTNE